jgi:glycosyltransferase involved in cell wall biosynthesis
MNIYFLPGTGIFGGIKTGYQLAALLDELGARSIVATPDGQAPQWFRTSVATVSHAMARSLLDGRSNVLFSLPHHHAMMKEVADRLIFHCVGTDPLIDPVIADPQVSTLTSWPQAFAYVMERTGRAPLEVGIAVSPCFYYDGTAKVAGTVSYMPRRGSDVAERAMRANPRLRFVAIENANEDRVADILKRSDFFLATAVGEWFGLPAFEAMAAGALVVTVPVVGGMDYLRHDVNCIVADPAELPMRLREFSAPAFAARRALMRSQARATASLLHVDRQRRMLRSLRDGPLGHLFS